MRKWFIIQPLDAVIPLRSSWGVKLPSANNDQADTGWGGSRWRVKLCQIG